MIVHIRLILFGLFICLAPESALSFDKNHFLNFALFNLPPEYFAEIPLNERSSLIREASSDPDHPGINYEESYFKHEFVQRSGAESVYLWLKLLPRDMERRVQNSYTPLVYIHLARSVPENKGEENGKYSYQTFVLKWERKSDDWVEITKSIIPETVDLSSHLPPKLKFNGVRVASRGMTIPSSPDKEILVWENWKLHVRMAYPFYRAYNWDAPFDPDRLAVLAFRPVGKHRETRELAQLIAHAGIVKDERFRPLLNDPGMKKVPLLAYALAAYEYALDQSETALDFIIEEVAKEGDGDTNSKWMLCFFDEWNRTLEAYKKYDGRDGAAAEASYMFVKQRQYFYPENFEKFWKKKMNEIKARD